jgi:hypothetical protein
MGWIARTWRSFSPSPEGWADWRRQRRLVEFFFVVAAFAGTTRLKLPHCTGMFSR